MCILCVWIPKPTWKTGPILTVYVLCSYPYTSSKPTLSLTMHSLMSESNLRFISYTEPCPGAAPTGLTTCGLTYLNRSPTPSTPNHLQAQFPFLLQRRVHTIPHSVASLPPPSPIKDGA